MLGWRNPVPVLTFLALLAVAAPLPPEPSLCGEPGAPAASCDQARRVLASHRKGDALVIFPESTSSDGNRVLPFHSSLLSAAELPLGEEPGHRIRHPLVQPVSIAYVGLHGMPMGRETRPFFAWYGDMELAPHLWEALATGPIDVIVEFHPPLTIAEAGGRKGLAERCEALVRSGLVRALAGSGPKPQPQQDQELLEALDQAEAAEI